MPVTFFDEVELFEAAEHVFFSIVGGVRCGSCGQVGGEFLFDVGVGVAEGDGAVVGGDVGEGVVDVGEDVEG